MSNSSRIEAATRQHVGAVLTAEQVTELVKLANPEWKGGVYPSDAAGKRLEDGTITYRGKTAYGDLVLEYMAENSFKVLPTAQVVRRKPQKKEVAASAEVKKVEVPAPVPTVAEKKGKKAAKSASQPPVAPKSKARSGQATQ